jgi:hypothetical protein
MKARHWLPRVSPLRTRFKPFAACHSCPLLLRPLLLVLCLLLLLLHVCRHAQGLMLLPFQLMVCIGGAITYTITGGMSLRQIWLLTCPGGSAGGGVTLLLMR